MANFYNLFSFLKSQSSPSGKIIADAMVEKIDEKILASQPSSAKAIWQITTSAATSISAVDTPTILAGTTTEVGTLTDFSLTSDNVLTYTGSDDVHVLIDGIFELSSGNNNVIKIYARQYDDSASSYVDLILYTLTETDGTGSIRNVCLRSEATISQNDRIEIWVENTTGSSDITASVGGQLIVSRF